MECGDRQFRIRLALVAGFLLLWLGATLWMLVHIAFVDRNEYLAFGRRIALESSRIYPPRGRILDRNHTPLAWSKRYFDLYLKELPLDADGDELLGALRKNFIGFATLPEFPDFRYGFRIKRNLSVAELARATELATVWPCLQIRQRVERMRVNQEDLAALLGRVDGYEGVSGMELTYNDVLRGTPGKYQVMLDRNRNWIEETLEVTLQPVPGGDVVLEYSLDELLEQAKEF